jgi:hypothetical protein
VQVSDSRQLGIRVGHDGFADFPDHWVIHLAIQQDPAGQCLTDDPTPAHPGRADIGFAKPKSCLLP